MLTLAFVWVFLFQHHAGSSPGWFWGHRVPVQSAHLQHSGGVDCLQPWPLPPQPIRVAHHALKSSIVDHLNYPQGCPACLHQGRTSFARQAQNLYNKPPQGAEPWPPARLRLSYWPLEEWSAGRASHCPVGGRAGPRPCFALCMLRTWPGCSMPHATAPALLPCPAWTSGLSW